MFQEILNDSSEPAKGEDKLAALTAGDRVPWAKARKSFFATGVNRASLTAIEKSSFVLALDDIEYNYSAVSSCIFCSSCEFIVYLEQLPVESNVSPYSSH